MAAAVEKAYSAIREGIVSGAFRPGTHLTARMLALGSGVSRTPVREAMRRLHAEGLIDFIPHRGGFVISWSRRDVADIFDLRLLLESYGAEMAARNISTQELDELRALAARMEEAVDSELHDFLRSVAEANGRFHKLILRASRNSRLEAVMASLIEMPLMLSTFHRYSRESLLRSMNHHRELIAALEAHDGAWSNAIMRSHILAARQVFRSSLDSRQVADQTLGTDLEV
jgi:DNA-binding GntR family transcriptional regulator